MKESTILLDQHVPINLWGRDHWSMLAYFRHVEINNAGFKVQSDPRMRQNRRHFRIMPGPKKHVGVPMDPIHGSRLSDGTYIPNHDDWNCVQDFAAAGLLKCTSEKISPGKLLHLSPKGTEIVEKLHAHKAEGGSFTTFTTVKALVD